MIPSRTTYYIKKEIDINWNEADNCYGEESGNLQGQCTARVVLEKLSESIVQDYISKKNAAPLKAHPELSKKCPRCKNILKTTSSLKTHMYHCGKERNLQCAHCSFKTKYKQTLAVHLSKVHQNGKKINQNEYKDDGRFARICQKCKNISEAVTPTRCERCFDKLLYQCNQCASQFKTVSLASYHWYTRCGVRGHFKCPKCNFKSVWRSKVVRHMKQLHHNLKSKQELEKIQWTGLEHDQERAESKTYVCPKCTKTMKNPISLSKHIQACGGPESAKNSDIHGKNSQDDNFNVESEPIKCSNCGKKFEHIYSLNRHIRNCSNKKYLTRITNDSDVEVVDTDDDLPFKSSVSADKRYSRYVKMIVRYCRKCNEDSVIEEKNWGIGSKVQCRNCKTTLWFKCKKCLKEYANLPNMKIHLDTICDPKEEFKCTKCNYRAYTPARIKGHYDGVHGTANTECEKCGIKFKSTRYLTAHSRRCGAELKFQCEHCSFKSKMKVYLRHHIFRSHMEPVVIDRRDLVTMSKHRFTQAVIHLEAHCSKCKNKQRLSQRLKTCEKCKTKLNFKCDTCKKEGNNDDENTCSHIKAYLEMIKFECKRCGRGVISEKSLYMHERTCGVKASFKCRFCKLTSKLKTNMAKHEKRMHPHKV